MSEEAVIHIVDDDEATRNALSFMLDGLGMKTILHDSAEALLGVIDVNVLGCILTDVRMPGMTGLELLGELSQRKCPLPVIMITGHGDVPMAVRTMRAGALDMIEKPVNGMTLLERINEALRLCRQRQAELLALAEAKARLASLTPREVEVARAVISGKQNKVIASALGISLKTVEIHRHNLMEKLDVKNAAALASLLVAAGWKADGNS